jgi:hypothetical protein
LYGKTPLALVHGRERIYFEHFWNDSAADRTHSAPGRDRRIYTKAYAHRGGLRAGFEYLRTFEKDAEDFAGSAKKPLQMPMLALTGEKDAGDFLIQQGRLVAKHVEGSSKKHPIKPSLNSGSFWEAKRNRSARAAFLRLLEHRRVESNHRACPFAVSDPLSFSLIIVVEKLVDTQDRQ